MKSLRCHHHFKDTFGILILHNIISSKQTYINYKDSKGKLKKIKVIIVVVFDIWLFEVGDGT